MNDPIFASFLQAQSEQGMALAAQSDLLTLEPVREPHALVEGIPQAYVATFHCKGLVRERDGEVREADRFEVGIYFARDHLRTVRPEQVLTWLSPVNAWHPNIRWPWICGGKIVAGVELVDLLYQCFEIITYFNWASHDGLNADACQWARNHQDRFPIDRRPLKRRTLNLDVTPEN
ncbi:MAG: hypothetical protein ACREJB_11280 [Planctomycetaceae bacterium]